MNVWKFENLYVLWGSSLVKCPHQTWIFFCFFVSCHWSGNDIMSRLRHDDHLLCKLCSITCHLGISHFLYIFVNSMVTCYISKTRKRIILCFSTFSEKGDQLQNRDIIFISANLMLYFCNGSYQSFILYTVLKLCYCSNLISNIFKIICLSCNEFPP